jgi:hypothetical protein
MTKRSNIAFEADAVRQYIVSCYRGAPCGSTQGESISFVMRVKIWLYCNYY